MQYPGSACRGTDLPSGRLLYIHTICMWGRRVIGIYGSQIWSKTLINWYLTPVVNFGEVRRAQLAKSTLLTSTLVPLRSSQNLRSVQMLKREWGAENNGKLPHLFKSQVKLQTWFLSLRKACHRQNCKHRFLCLQWRTCPWAEHSDDEYACMYILFKNVSTNLTIHSIKNMWQIANLYRNGASELINFPILDKKNRSSLITFKGTHKWNFTEILQNFFLFLS